MFRALCLKKLKLVDLKSRDCHVLMQQLLLVAIRDILLSFVKGAISRLFLFFNAICKKERNSQMLDELENEASDVNWKCILHLLFLYHGALFGEEDSIVWPDLLELDLPY